MNADSGAKELILEAERRRQAALISLDLDTLDALFADDLVHIHSTGLVHSKAELMRHIERRRAFISIERGPLEVRVCGNIAVMTGTMMSCMRVPTGSDVIFMNGFVTQVLQCSSNGWKFINFQLTLNRED